MPAERVMQTKSTDEANGIIPLALTSPQPRRGRNMIKHTKPMKDLHIQVDEAVYEEFCRLLPSYGERSRVMRELLRQHVEAEKR